MQYDGSTAIKVLSIAFAVPLVFSIVAYFLANLVVIRK